MPAALLDPAAAYLRKQCGLPPKPSPAMLETDPDDPARRLLTTAEAARAAHVDEARVRDWARRGLIEPVTDAGGQPLYQELAVLTAEARTRRAARERALATEAMQGLTSAST